MRQVVVKVLEGPKKMEPSLFAELGYVVSQLHKDTFRDIEIVHRILCPTRNARGDVIEIVSKEVMRCLKYLL